MVCCGFSGSCVALREPGIGLKKAVFCATEGSLQRFFGGGDDVSLFLPDTAAIVIPPAVAALISRQRRTSAEWLKCVFLIGALRKGWEGRTAVVIWLALTDAGCIACVQSSLIQWQSTKGVVSCGLNTPRHDDLWLVFHPDESSLSEGGCAHEGLDVDHCMV